MPEENLDHSIEAVGGDVDHTVLEAMSAPAAPGLRLVRRAAWGARPARAAAMRLASTRGVKVHYTGGFVDPRMADDHRRCAPAVRAIQNQHMDGNGWNDIGYSMIACPHRYVFAGRGPHALPAANGPGLNSGHYAVLGLVGTRGLIQPTDAMLHGIRDAIDYLRKEGRAGTEIKGHRDGYATSCPGGPLYAWVLAGAYRPGQDDPSPHTTPAATAPTTVGTAPAWRGRLLIHPPITRGTDVRIWQQRMRERGWRITVDGAYGPASQSTCKKFQKEKGLYVDGIVGPITWRATWQTPIT